jgi:hypothetical protein
MARSRAAIDLVPLLAPGRLEDIVDHLIAIAGMADADAQAPELLGAEMGGDVLQAVVTTQAAAKFKAQLAGWNIQLVVNHQGLGGENAVKAGQGADRLTRAIHESLGQQQPNALLSPMADQAMKTGFERKRNAQPIGQAFAEPEPGVVPGVGVFPTRIAEADDQANAGLHRQSAPGSERARPDQAAASPVSPSASALAPPRDRMLTTP